LKTHGVQALAWVRVWKRRIAILAPLTIAVSLCVYALWVEPYWIEVTHHRISAPLGSPLKIAHLTDIHTSGLGWRERRMLQLIEAEQPDLIVITGDSINITSDYPGLADVLSQLHAPLGVWVVRGNHEDWWPVKNEKQFYESAGARLLVNASAEVREGIWLIGLDDLYAASPDASAALRGVPESAYKIALFHSPPYFEKMAGRCDLAFSGHTHGGQIRLPVIGPLWKPPFSGRFVEGWYEDTGTRMYVSRGVGTSILDVRFWCRPEIAIITIGG